MSSLHAEGNLLQSAVHTPVHASVNAAFNICVSSSLQSCHCSRQRRKLNLSNFLWSPCHCAGWILTLTCYHNSLFYSNAFWGEWLFTQLAQWPNQSFNFSILVAGLDKHYGLYAASLLVKACFAGSFIMVNIIQIMQHWYYMLSILHQPITYPAQHEHP